MGKSVLLSIDGVSYFRNTREFMLTSEEDIDKLPTTTTRGTLTGNQEGLNDICSPNSSVYIVKEDDDGNPYIEVRILFPDDRWVLC